MCLNMAIRVYGSFSARYIWYADKCYKRLEWPEL